MPVSKPPKRTIRRKASQKSARNETPEPTLADIEQDVIELESLRGQASSISDKISVTQGRLNAAFDALGKDGHTFERNGARFSATYVQSDTVVLDQDKLKKRLGAALWKKVTSVVFDKKKLEALVSSGEIKAADVAACSEMKPRTPYTKVMKKTVES